MSDFEWQTDEEWSDEVLVSAETPRRWGTWLLLGGFVAIIAGAGWWQLRGRVAEMVQEVEQEIIASFNLLYEAVQNGDTELAYTLLSGSDADWTMQEQAKIAAATWLRWPELGWELVEEPEIVNVAVGSDLRSAEITLALRYKFNNTSFSLHRTLTFRQGETHWLYAPPPLDYWGEGNLLAGSPTDALPLDFVYPVRDANLIERFHTDINKKHQLFQQQYTPNAIRAFNTSLIVFREQSQTFTHLQPSTSEPVSISLPAPSTIGVPIDDNGYQQLLTAYSTYLLTFPAAAEVDYRCCQHAIFGQALGEYILERVGFQVVQLTEKDYTRVLQGNGRFDNQLLGWNSAETTHPMTDEWRTARAFVEYIHEVIPLHAVTTQMGRNLTQTEQFDEWLQTVAHTRMLSSVILDNGQEMEPTFAGFQAFLSARGALAVDDAPYPLPTAQPVVACLDNIGGSRLYAYNFGSYTWDSIGDFVDPVTKIDTLDMPKTLWIEQGRALSGVWQDGQHTHQTATLVNFSAEWQTLDTQPVVMRQSLGDDATTNNYYWLNPNKCHNEQGMQLTGCELTPLDGIPRWSPNREHIIFTDHVGGRLTLTDSNLNVIHTRTDITDIQSIVWINDTQYSWRNPVDGAHYRSSIDEVSSEKWFTNTNLNLVTPLADQQFNPNLYIYPTNNLSDPYLLIMQIFEGDVPQHLFKYNNISDELSYLGEISYNEYIGMSPDGRFIMAVRARPSTVMRLSQSLNLLETDSNRFYSYDYGTPVLLSDEWVLLNDADRLRLIAPSDGYTRLIPLPSDNCTDAAWLLSDELETAE